MTDAGRNVDPSRLVIVPTRPGPLEQVIGSDRDRNDIDELLDDMLGEPDDRGPGAADAVLIAGGAGAVVAGIAASLPAIVTVGGAAAIGLGAILPLRSVWRRLAGRRRRAQFDRRLAGGLPLRIDHETLAGLVDAHGRLTEAARDLDITERSELESVAHAAVYEVASLLNGHRPTSPAELEYVESRTRVLGELADVVAEVVRADGDPVARRARIEARREVEHQGGSSLTDATELIEELRRGAR